MQVTVSLFFLINLCVVVVFAIHFSPVADCLSICCIILKYHSQLEFANIAMRDLYIVLFVATFWRSCKNCIFQLSVLFTGSRIGTMEGMLASGVLCHYSGWKSIFYVFGTLTDFIFF